MKPRMLLLLAALLLVIIAALIIVMNRSSIGVALSSGHRAGGNRKPFTYASAPRSRRTRLETDLPSSPTTGWSFWIPADGLP